MNAGMKMLMLANSRKGDSNRAGGRIESQDGDYARMGYDGAEGYYGAESKFRDRRGREHYDNGRFAPRNEMGYDEAESKYSRMGMEENRDQGRMDMGHYPFQMSMGGGEHMNQIGFQPGRGMENVYYMDGEYRNKEDVTRRGHSMQNAQMHTSDKLTKAMADEWMEGLKNEDGTSGPHWTMEQTKQVMAQKGVSMEPVEFYAAINAIYSDFSKVFKKHGVGDKIDFYVDMAKAFAEDKDAQPDKLARYFQYVVKH